MTAENNKSNMNMEPDATSKSQCGASNWQRIILMPLVTLFLVLFVFNEATYLQTKEDFDVSRIISDVKKRFNLSARDIKSIRPFLNRENKNVITIYARFTGAEPGYSDRLWLEIAAGHCEFSSSPSSPLTKRQSSALLAARQEFEMLIVNYVVDDYVDFLAQVLELERWEFSDVEALFQSDKAQKLRALASVKSSDLGVLQKEVEKISSATETKLRKVLTEEQWRTYRSLTESMVPTA